MLVKDRLVVKLPAARVEELVGEGDRRARSIRGTDGSRRNGCRSSATIPAEWHALATESEAFVARRPG